MAPRTKHVPLRRCVRCRASLPKGELLRLVRDEQGDWRIDEGGRAPGRGAWLCAACAVDAKEKDLKRAFRGAASTVAAALERRRHEARSHGRDA